MLPPKMHEPQWGVPTKMTFIFFLDQSSFLQSFSQSLNNLVLSSQDLYDFSQLLFGSFYSENKQQESYWNWQHLQDTARCHCKIERRPRWHIWLSSIAEDLRNVKHPTRDCGPMERAVSACVCWQNHLSLLVIAFQNCNTGERSKCHFTFVWQSASTEQSLQRTL